MAWPGRTNYSVQYLALACAGTELGHLECRYVFASISISMLAPCRRVQESIARGGGGLISRPHLGSPAESSKRTPVDFLSYPGWLTFRLLTLQLVGGEDMQCHPCLVLDLRAQSHVVGPVLLDVFRALLPSRSGGGSTDEAAVLHEGHRRANLDVPCLLLLARVHVGGCFRDIEVRKSPTLA